MKSLKLAAFLLCLAILISGCTVREIPIESAQEDPPAPTETVQPTAAPTPEPTQEPVIETPQPTEKIPSFGSLDMITDLPADMVPEVFDDVPNRGTVQQVEYTTTVKCLGGRYTYGGLPLPASYLDTTVTKPMDVYLPYGYDPSQQYNVMLLLHGFGGNQTYYLRDKLWVNGVQISGSDILDAMIYYGYCEPLIVIAPTTKINGVNVLEAQQMGQEIRNDILPYVVENFATYAVPGEDISAYREHFAIGGASDGGIATVETGLGELSDLFGWFGNYSGDPYGYSLDNVIDPVYYYLVSAGETDFTRAVAYETYDGMRAKGHTDDNNSSFIVVRGEDHTDPVWMLSLYDSLLIFFNPLFMK